MAPAPVGASMRQNAGVTVCNDRSHPIHAATIGLDLAKDVFQVHGVTEAGKVVFNRAIKRRHLLTLFERTPRCVVGMEACESAHHWARELTELGHDARLMRPISVKIP